MSVSSAQSSDQAAYSCSALWDEHAEPSNDINVQVMGMCIIVAQSDHSYFIRLSNRNNPAMVIGGLQNF